MHACRVIVVGNLHYMQQGPANVYLLDFGLLWKSCFLSSSFSTSIDFICCRIYENSGGIATLASWSGFGETNFSLAG